MLNYEEVSSWLALAITHENGILISSGKNYFTDLEFENWNCIMYREFSCSEFIKSLQHLKQHPLYDDGLIPTPADETNENRSLVFRLERCLLVMRTQLPEVRVPEKSYKINFSEVSEKGKLTPRLMPRSSLRRGETL